MVGYPESLTDPSFAGQILVLTYPLVGNYGVPDASQWESKKIWCKGLIVSRYQGTPSHFESTMSLGSWLKSQKIPALEIPDTRELTLKLRQNGIMKGVIFFGEKPPKEEALNLQNVVSLVSQKNPDTKGHGKLHITLIDCGAKNGIRESLLQRDVTLTTVPWNYDFIEEGLKTDGIVVSNGPGDPTDVPETIAIVRKALAKKIPLFGICLGNQILSLAGGGNTYKLPFGHRGQNQPVQDIKTKKCYLTTQNHGYAVGIIPKGFKPWFINLNDQTNEGIRHESLPFCSVQFHPEAKPGPEDTDYLFDDFLQVVKADLK
jgi:carbamoyl-phosphate synthase small subunit